MRITDRWSVLFMSFALGAGHAGNAHAMDDVFHPCQVRSDTEIEVDLAAQGKALEAPNALATHTRALYDRLLIERAMKQKTPDDLDLAIRQAYYNTLFTGANLAIQKFASEIRQQAVAECKKLMLADYLKPEPATDSARKAADAASARLASSTTLAIDRARVIAGKQTVAQHANDEAETQFLELRIARLGARTDEATKLAALVPNYPGKAGVDPLEASLAVSKAADVATKSEALAKEAQGLADASAAQLLAVDKTGKPKIDRDAAAQVAAAVQARAIALDAESAQRLAKQARDASDFVVEQGLRAKSKADVSLTSQDLAVAQASALEVDALKSRVARYRTDALLTKLGIDAATPAQRLSVVQQREYVTFLSVLADNPDAQALLGAPGVKLKADSGDTSATLKLSMDQVLGRQTRLVDLTLTAPVTKTRTSYVDTVDGLAKGFTAKLTGTRYWLMPPNDAPTLFGILGGGARVGHESHTYVDDADLSKTVDVTRTPDSAFAFAGLAPVDMKWLLLGKFEFQRAYQDGDDGTHCPAQASGVVTCQSGPIGAPKLAHKRIWSVEARRAWDRYAVGALVSRDLAARQTKVDLPIYLVTGTSDKGSSPLTGGIDLGWDTKHHATFGIFVGTAFSVADY